MLRCFSCVNFIPYRVYCQLFFFCFIPYRVYFNGKLMWLYPLRYNFFIKQNNRVKMNAPWEKTRHWCINSWSEWALRALPHFYCQDIPYVHMYYTLIISQLFSFFCTFVLINSAVLFYIFRFSACNIVLRSHISNDPPFNPFCQFILLGLKVELSSKCH